MKPVFSIITPTFNRGYCIWKAIQSAQNQTFKDWEMIIVDDGSTDDTKKVVAEFQNDPRIKYFHQKHGGTSKTRNAGMKLSKGEIICFLDSDDIYYSNCLKTVFEYFQKNPEKIFAIPDWKFRLEFYDKNYKLLEFKDVNPKEGGSEINLQDIYHWNIKSAFGSGLFLKKEVIKKELQFDENLKVFDDWDFVMELGKAYPDGLLYIPEVLFEYNQRYGGDSTCSTMNYSDWADGFEALYKKHNNDSLMQGQKWYPLKVEKFKRLQKEFEEGKIVPPEFRYFPQYYEH